MLANDEVVMRRALELAERGRGGVEPNPLVGAVIVRAGQIVGEGWHARFGEAHAEIAALHNAGEQARGATLYVTLEPCCHQGKTPPCTQAILKSGIRRVVAAMLDPFPAVAGRGVEVLRASGVEVDAGLLEAEARELNAPYLKLLRTGRPWIIAKWAMSLDGKIATRSGAARWITGEAARARVHELRGRMDGILVGSATALADDPLLTARPPGPRVAARIVLDSRLRLPLTSQLAQTTPQAPVLLVHTSAAHPENREQLVAAGCECLCCDGTAEKPAVLALLEELGRRRFTNILVEGGAKVLGHFHDLAAIDEVYAFVAPTVIGGADAPSALAGLGAVSLADARALYGVQMEMLDVDVLIHGRVRQGTSS